MIPALIAAIVSSLAGWLVALWLNDRLKAKEAALEYWRESCQTSQVDSYDTIKAIEEYEHSLSLARSEAAVLRSQLWLAQQQLESTKP